MLTLAPKGLVKSISGTNLLSTPVESPARIVNVAVLLGAFATLREFCEMGKKR